MCGMLEEKFQAVIGAGRSFAGPISCIGIVAPCWRHFWSLGSPTAAFCFKPRVFRLFRLPVFVGFLVSSGPWRNDQREGQGRMQNAWEGTLISKLLVRPKDVSKLLSMQDRTNNVEKCRAPTAAHVDEIPRLAEELAGVGGC